MLRIFHNLVPKIIFISILICLTASDDPCGDWVRYKDEKCIKIFDEPGLLNYEDAENFCKLTDDSHLITIGVEENQNFIVQFLKSNEIVDNLWIGLKYVNDNYEWADDTEVHYTNWAGGSPKNDSNYCVQIQVDEEQFGKWSEFQCSKKNLVICEKIQLWSQNYLQNQVIELQFAVNQSKENEKRLENLIGEISARLNNLENTVTVVTENPVPLGFIYVQLPNEQSPSEIWPQVVWQDVSPNYAGVFFRAEGGGSAAFGEVQGENSPRLTHVKKTSGPTVREIDVVADGNPSQMIDVEQTKNSDIGFQFTVSGGEVRPKNMAIRIWKRVQ